MWDDSHDSKGEAPPSIDSVLLCLDLAGVLELGLGEAKSLILR